MEICVICGCICCQLSEELTALYLVTGNSTLLVQGQNTSGQVDGQWAGVGVELNAAGIVLSADSVITADGQGYAGGEKSSPGKGPGGGPIEIISYTAIGTGAGHGVAGGSSKLAAGGSEYGSVVAPLELGSGGGTGSYGTGGGVGGGAIAVHVTGTLTLNGTVSANGMKGEWGGDGAGSGGLVFITAGNCADVVQARSAG